MKCGTVSLHRYLSCHPEIFMPPLVELDFFVKERNWQKGLDWYESHFPEQAKVIGERSTAYSKYPDFKGIPERVHRLIPHAKLIYIIRDPVERIVSQYIHWFARGYENRSFADAIHHDFPNNSYIYYSRYYLQLEQYLEFFPIANILVLKLEDMAKERRGYLKSIFKFLEVDPEFDNPEFYNEYHKSIEKSRATRLSYYLKQVRGMHRLEKYFPSLFRKPIIRPQLSETLREKIREVVSDDLEKINSYCYSQIEEVNL